MARVSQAHAGPGTAPTALTDEQREIARLQNEVATTKQQLKASAPANPVPDVKYTTTNPAEATLYSEAGGTLVTITKLYPGSMKSGKRYGFVQTKAELDALVKLRQEEAGG